MQRISDLGSSAVAERSLETRGFGNPRRQRFQMQRFDGVQLTRNRADMFLVSRVDLIAPLPRPLIQILPTAEGAPRQKVILDEMEGTLDARRTIRISNRVRHELETETLSTGGHLRHPDHVASPTAHHAQPPDTNSSWTRTRFPLHCSKSSRICCRCGSAFSGRRNSGTVVEFERRTLRTAMREIPSTRAISRLLTCCAFSSRIVVRCAWLNMRFLLR